MTCFRVCCVFLHNSNNNNIKIIILQRGCGLLSVEDTMLHEQLSIKKYLACSAETLLQTVYQSSQHSTPLESLTKFKAKRKLEHFEAWRDKPLHGQFAREIVDTIDVSQEWRWLSSSNLNKECEGLIMAAQDQAITTNCIG